MSFDGIYIRPYVFSGSDAIYRLAGGCEVTLSFTESIVEDAALAWLESLGWTPKNGLEIAPGELAAERISFGQVVLEQRL